MAAAALIVDVMGPGLCVPINFLSIAIQEALGQCFVPLRFGGGGLVISFGGDSGGLVIGFGSVDSLVNSFGGESNGLVIGLVAKAVAWLTVLVVVVVIWLLVQWQKWWFGCQFWWWQWWFGYFLAQGIYFRPWAFKLDMVNN